MKRIDTFFMYHMGALIGPLGEIEAGDSRGRYRYQAAAGHKLLRNLLSKAPGSPTILASSTDEAWRLKRCVDRVVEIANDDPITEPEAISVRDAFLAFSTAFRQVLYREPAFYPEQVGIYDTAMLVEHAERVFPQDIQARLSDTAKSDWILAGRCLGFGLGTACGFHTVRATESLIQEYYVTVTGDIAMKRKDRNWGAYVRNLNRHRKLNPQSRADPKLIALIDQIREHHRNVIIHPEETLDESQAMGLFNICQSATTSFVGEIAALKAAGVGLAGTP